MNPHKENIIKNACFKSAVNIYTRMMPNEFKTITDHDTTVIYSIAIRLWINGKDRYSKSMNPHAKIVYRPRILKRICFWLKESFWEKKIKE